MQKQIEVAKFLNRRITAKISQETDGTYSFQGFYIEATGEPYGREEHTETGFKSEEAAIAAARFNFSDGRVDSWKEAEELAASLTSLLDAVYLPYDMGEYHSPRFGVVKLPKIGDLVSKGFNGDYYPEGTVVSISKSYKKISTSTGVHFYRFRQTRSWVSHGTWGMVRGHVSERNPSF